MRAVEIYEKALDIVSFTTNRRKVKLSKSPYRLQKFSKAESIAKNEKVQTNTLFILEIYF